LALALPQHTGGTGAFSGAGPVYNINTWDSHSGQFSAIELPNLSPPFEWYVIYDNSGLHVWIEMGGMGL
jgi:hypothetical protein